MVLTFPVMVIKVNTIEDVVEWRWSRMAVVGIGVFFLSALYRYLLYRRKMGARRDLKAPKLKLPGMKNSLTLDTAFFSRKEIAIPGSTAIGLVILIYPMVMSMYQTSIMSTALLYVVLGLGLNIVIGFGGMLHLGYIAFYAVGAYTYALLNHHFGVGF